MTPPKKSAAVRKLSNEPRKRKKKKHVVEESPLFVLKETDDDDGITELLPFESDFDDESSLGSEWSPVDIDEISLDSGLSNMDDFDAEFNGNDDGSTKSNSTTSTFKKDQTPTNVIFDRNEILNLMTRSFLCKCGHPLDRHSITIHTQGIASSMNFECRKCLLQDAAKATKSTTDPSDKLINAYKHPNREALDLAHRDYDLNRKLILAMQLNGLGNSAARTIFSVLGVSVGALGRKWTPNEEKLASVEMELTQRILDSNLEEEKRLSPSRNGRPGLTLLMDAGWQTRGSGNSYTSLSGNHVSIGGRTETTCFVQSFSKSCAKCDRGECDRGVLCSNPQNFGGHSKAMEGQGAADTAAQLLSKGCYLTEVVTDDDSTQRSILSRRIADLVEVKILPCYPTTPAGNAVTCHGVLPVANGSVRHLACRNHRIRTMKGRLYDLVRMPVSRSICEKSDAERISRNLAFALYMHHDKPIYEFVKHMRVAVEHHFDNHDGCDSIWCGTKKSIDGAEATDPMTTTEETELEETAISSNQMKTVYSESTRNMDGKTMPQLEETKTEETYNEMKEETLIEVEKNNDDKYYRSKTRHPNLYAQVEKALAPYMTEEALAQIQHLYTTNKCESIMNQICQVLPKNMTFCRTICGRGRVSLALGMDSKGKEEYIRWLCFHWGTQFCPILEEWSKREDKRRKQQHKKRSSSDAKLKRARRKLDMIKLETRKTATSVREGKDYATGVAMKATTGEALAVTAKKRMKPKITCPHCGVPGHKRTTSKFCRAKKMAPSDTLPLAATGQPSVAWAPDLDEIPFQNAHEIVMVKTEDNTMVVVESSGTEMGPSNEPLPGATNRKARLSTGFV
jgi:hypothetical protein